MLKGEDGKVREGEGITKEWSELKIKCERNTQNVNKYLRNYCNHQVTKFTANYASSKAVQLNATR